MSLAFEPRILAELHTDGVELDRDELAAYLKHAMLQARIGELEDHTFFGSIEALPGVWADGTNREECFNELESVLEDWIALGARLGHPFPRIDGITLRPRATQAPRLGPISRRDLLHYLRELGFVGPFSGGDDEFLVNGTHKVHVPNPHRGDISPSLLRRILEQAGIPLAAWEQL